MAKRTQCSGIRSGMCSRRSAARWLPAEGGRHIGRLSADDWIYNGAVSRYLARRLALTIPVLLGVATLVFSLIHLIPGDPAQAMLGETASPQDVADLRERLGLDRPLIEQYGVFLRGLTRGDLGT